MKSDFSGKTRFIVIITLIFGLMISTCVQVSASGDARAVRGDFVNSLKVPPGINSSGSVSFFSGHAQQASAAPTNGSLKLPESSFGQAVANSVPYPNFQQAVIDRSKKMLYYEFADQTGDFSKAIAAFRYKVLLYNPDPNDPYNRIIAQFSKISDNWTDAERNRALQAAQDIRNALIYDPQHTGLRKALLDIYYDIAVADLAKANEKVVEAQKAALGLPGYLSPPGEFQISKEIQLLNEAIPLFDAAIKPYFDLLKDPMGIDMSGVDSSAGSVPFGYYLFQKEVPTRSLYAPNYVDSNGNLQGVVDQTVLFTGYKDLVLLFKMEEGMSQIAAKLAKLYALRSAPGDADKARLLIGNTQQKSYTDGSILNGIFPQSVIGNIDKNSGLAEAKAIWAQGLSALSSVKAFLDGNANPLGLDKDFLALVQTDVPSGDTAFQDSFNYFVNMIIPGGLNPNGQLGVAKAAYDTAFAQYEKVQVNKDTIKTELEAQRDKFGDRLLKIVGCCYPDPLNPYCPITGCSYNTPENNKGGEIYIQIQSINSAKLRIQHNQQEIDNLQAQVQNEIERRGKETGINNLMAQTYIRYGDKQTELIKKIGDIRACAAASNAAAAACSSANPIVVIANSLNGVVQFFLTLREYELQAEKERLTALQQADIVYLSDKIQDANSEAVVKNLLLGMHTLAIESQEAVIVLAQEIGRLQSLLDEKAYLEAQWKKASQDLGSRYFADPAHRIIMDQRIIEADFAFQDAQFWLFVMARALDYKRNTRFITTFGGKTYTSASVFALRNAKELTDMAQALWNYDQTRNIGDRQGTQFVRFSVREDFLGYRNLNENGQTAYYPDPITGKMVTASDAFHSYLKKRTSTDQMQVSLEFDTVRSNFGDTFFSPKRWNEKIKWMSIKINAISSATEIMVDLTQSGAGFIRNFDRGTVDPAHPDRIIGEMTGYPVKYWYKDNTGNWASKDSFGFGINAVVNTDPNAPPESLRKTEFHEMPPAISKWTLNVPLKNSSGYKLLDTDKISDIEVWFYNYYHARNL